MQEAYTRRLRIDVETFSRVSLKAHGLHRYVEDDSFELVLFQYRYDDWPAGLVKVVEVLNGESIPDAVAADIVDPSVRKSAWNAPFERQTLAAHFGQPMPPEQWECTMVRAASLGLPMSLDQAGVVLDIKNRKKVGPGAAAMRYFCLPCKPTKANGERTRNLPAHDPDKWALLIDYAATDVLAEAEIGALLDAYPMDSVERAMWVLDQKMNDHGVHVDVELAKRAVELDAQYKARCLERARVLTGLSNPNSVSQLVNWLQEKHGIPTVQSLDKKAVREMLRKATDPALQEVLRLRQELSRTSVQKYAAAVNRTSEDGFLRSVQQFYGAIRTGRWAGRGLQPQNMPSNGDFADMGLARDLLREGRFDELSLLFGSPSYALSMLMRTVLIPDSPDELLLACDFSAIEARALAWGAGEKWRLEVFRTHGKIYEASASTMFGVPFAEFAAYAARGKKHPLRQKGKIAELALGYQGGEGALETMGALDMGLQAEELPGIKTAWRAANPAIAGQSYLGQEPGMWEKMDVAARQAVRRSGVEVPVPGVPGTSFFVPARRNTLFMVLPSGRRLAYPAAKLDTGRFDNECVSYMGPDETTSQWVRIQSYGGKWTENWCQAVSRDVLRDKLLRAESTPEFAGRLRFSVHDEAVYSVLTDDAERLRVKLQDIFAEPLPWAEGFPLQGECDVLDFYRKGE
jgi:DNA polymerase